MWILFGPTIIIWMFFEVGIMWSYILPLVCHIYQFWKSCSRSTAVIVAPTEILNTIEGSLRVQLPAIIYEGKTPIPWRMLIILIFFLNSIAQHSKALWENFYSLPQHVLYTMVTVEHWLYLKKLLSNLLAWVVSSLNSVISMLTEL